MGHAGARLAAENLRPGGHLPPAEKLHTLLAGDDLQPLLGLVAGKRGLGQEEHAHGVIPGAAQGNAHVSGDFFKKLVGNLQKDAHAVAGLSSGVLAGAVLQLFHDLQRVVHGLVGGDAVNGYHGADAAGVVLQGQGAA